MRRIVTGWRCLALLGCSIDPMVTPGAEAGPSTTSATPGTTVAETAGASAPSDPDGSAGGSFGGSGGGTADTVGPDQTPRNELYIRPEPFPRLVFEVDHVGGLAPYASVSTDLEHMLAGILGKPGGIEVVIDTVLPPAPEPDPVWSPADLYALAEENFDLPVPDDTIKVHVLVLDGGAEEDWSNILGQAWGLQTIVLYKERIVQGCVEALLGSLESTLCQRLELLVWEHEMGHVLGLVGFGLPMVRDHKDPDGPHDVDPACVMHREKDQVDAIASLAAALLAGEPRPEFGPDCLADIDAVR